MNRLVRSALACVALAMLSGCGFVIVHGVRHAYVAYTTKQENEINAALARYRTLTLRMQPEKVAAMFDLNGEVSHESQDPVIGREAILAFVNSFVGYKILEYELTATSTAVQGESATQKGTYRQKVIAPTGETVAVQGTFEARWSRQTGSWLISRMHTVSAPINDGG